MHICKIGNLIFLSTGPYVQNQPPKNPHLKLSAHLKLTTPHEQNIHVGTDRSLQSCLHTYVHVTPTGEQIQKRNREAKSAAGFFFEKAINQITSDRRYSVRFCRCNNVILVSGCQIKSKQISDCLMCHSATMHVFAYAMGKKGSKRSLIN